MGEEKIDKKEQQKQEEQEASKKALKTGAKTAANASLGPLAGKAVDLASKTKLGNAVLDKGANTLNKNPFMGKIMNAANKTGALDAADKAGNATSGGTGSEDKSSLLGKGKSSSLSNSKNDPKKEQPDGDFSGNGDYSSKIFSFIKKHRFKLISVFGGFFLVFTLAFLVIAIVASPVAVVTGFFSGVADLFLGFIEENQKKLEQEYYEELQTISDKIYKADNICIDVNLITATLTVNMPADDLLINGEEAAPEEIDYKKMTKQVELLANMQIKRKKYGWDKRLSGTHCIDGEDDYELVTADNQDYFDNPAIFGENGKDSSTAELVSRHDLSGFAKFFTKKVNEERNYEYIIYRPAFTIETVTDAQGNVLYNPDGTVQTRKVCNATLERDFREEPEISIGDLSSREDHVYYWNLVNSFIPEYYSEYLPESDPQRTEAIKRIADDIYLLYKDAGPKQICTMNASYICRSDEGASFYGGGEQNLTRKEFMENISPVAIAEMNRTGIFASITLSQAALESGNGSSGLSTKYSNYYGMTAGRCAPSDSPSSLVGTVYQSGEGGNSCQGNAFWNGSVVAACNRSGNDCQWYRIYDSFENSTKDHSRLLSDSYGCNVYQSYSEQLDCLVAHGYATDPSYKNKIINQISLYGLAEYDIGEWNGEIVPVSENQYNSVLCYSNGMVAAGEFTSWKQYNPAWSSVKLGPSTVGSIGCAMTSVAMQIMRSGVSTTLGSDFNPGTFATEMTRIGGFDSLGNIYWGKVSEIASGFILANRVNKKVSPDEIASLISQGYYVILQVKNGRHWVAVDRVENGKVYMFDPGSGGTEVGETYGLSSIVGYTTYRRG